MKTIERDMFRGSAVGRFNHKQIAFFLLAIAVLHAWPLTAAVLFVSPEWKAHFKTKLVVENCVFVERNSSFDETNMFQIRYEQDAFLVRQITSLDEAAQDHIIGGASYAGRQGSNYWAIEGGMVLKLFPNADNLLKEKIRNPDLSLIEAPRRKLIGALFYGFHLIDPNTMQWLDETTFQASSFQGEKFRGEVLQASDGLPTVLQWHAEANPALQFTTEYKYLNKFDLPYYPSEISLRAALNGRTTPVVTYQILALKTASAPLPTSSFDSARYFAPPAPSSPSILVVTNDQIYASNNAGWVKVLNKAPDDSGINKNVAKALVLGFVVLSAIGLFLVWRHTKEKA